MAGYGLVVGGLGWRAAPWQARRSYAGDIGALYLRQHESQGRAQRLLGLEMPQPASPPCRRHAAPLPRDAATRESAMPPPRRPPCLEMPQPASPPCHRHAAPRAGPWLHPPHAGLARDTPAAAPLPG